LELVELTPGAETPKARYTAAVEDERRRRPYEVAVRVRDGTRLAADCYLPENNRERPVPCLVRGTPYDKGAPGSEVDARFFVDHGYGYVVYDTRGRGKSEGEWRAHVEDGPDGHDVIEWVASQPWSSGKVGTTGVSYSGWNQWATAREHPPHMVCMASFAAAGRWMQEVPYTNGVFQLYYLYWLMGTSGRIQPEWSTVDPGELLYDLPIHRAAMELGIVDQSWRDFLDHDTLDSFWKQLRLDSDYQSIGLPCLHVAGWHDREDLLGAFHHYESMIINSPCAMDQWLVVGPWPHSGVRHPQAEYGGVDFGTDAALDMDALLLKYCDYWLKGEPNGWNELPRVRIFETGTNQWLFKDRWPSKTQSSGWYLGTSEDSGRLSKEPPANQELVRTFSYDPLDPVCVPGPLNFGAVLQPSLDEGYLRERQDVVLYASDPLEGSIRVRGRPRLNLFAASDCEDTDWHVKLHDIWPDGRLIRVSGGCLRAACRESLEVMSPLHPTAVYRFDIELSPVSHTFLEGHHIGLSITSSDFPWFARNLNSMGKILLQDHPRVAANSIHSSREYPSCLSLPTVSD
jgi:putative CocE/NonD family hydrolase